jgi:pseudoazurin
MKFLAVAALALVASSPAFAAEHVVMMLNKGAAGMMVFEPALVKAAPGDTVRFVPTDKSHNAESINGMLPSGATPFKGKMNQEVSVTVTKPGVYGVKCAPHYGMGMVGLIVAGKPTNVAEAATVTHPGKAKPTFAKLLASAK